MMNIDQKINVRLWASIFVTLGLLAPMSHANDDQLDTTYACSVKTESGQAGLIFAQAQDLTQAKEMIVGASVETVMGLPSTATEVTQCIVSGEGEFRDSLMQKFYSDQPR